MIYVLSDFNRVVGVVRSTLHSIEPRDMKKLKEEFYALNQAGPNPWKHDTPEQDDWFAKSNKEQFRLIDLYGGEYFGVDTFIGWLCKEKHFERVKFTEYCLAEFD
jgi:hypothetical protein